jgi:hypothetical protein
MNRLKVLSAAFVLWSMDFADSISAVLKMSNVRHVVISDYKNADRSSLE